MSIYSRVPTSKEVCERCCSSLGRELRWGMHEECEVGCFPAENSFYCPVTDRTIYNPDNPGSLQPDCPRRKEHLLQVCPDCGESQGILLEASVEGSNPERQRFSAVEATYAEEWKKQNKRSPGVNGGHTLLEHICSEEITAPAPVSVRDSFVAASVIQWLGTNCGLCFIKTCEERARELKGIRKVADKLMGESW